jgi:hypothetical protein
LRLGRRFALGLPAKSRLAFAEMQLRLLYRLRRRIDKYIQDFTKNIGPVFDV